ncbi:MAG TPA: PKD domain-containing protein [Thermoanaerobaculia bacterium]|nr:PKD domain-containing protein [Thermoanaerobaculia bacterium]
MIMGSMFASFKLSTFFGGVLGSPIVPAPVSRQENSGTVPSEQYLAPDATFYAERDWPGLTCPPTCFDGQDRLPGFDYDDRGDVYLANSIFGWGILQDNGTSFSSLIHIKNTPKVGPSQIVALKSGAKYYTLVLDGSGGVAFDSTIATTPSSLGPIQAGLGASSVAKTDDLRFGATANYQLTGAVFDALTSVTTPKYTVATTTGGSIAYVSTDGRYFYFLDRGPYGGTSLVHVFDPVLGQETTSYNVPAIDGFSPSGIHVSPNHVVLWGGDSSGYGTLHLYKIVNGALSDMGVTDFLHKYYNVPTDGYSSPKGYPGIHDALFYQGGGKNYFFYSSDGLGDVYEVQDGDAIQIARSQSGFGTTNPSSPTAGQGPYYGDFVRFTSSGTGQAATASINWNFGNPESTDNTFATTVGTAVSHQYAGITTATGIAAVKQAKAVGATNSSFTADLPVSLLTPLPRVGLPAAGLTLNSGQAITASIVLGDQFVDASDGSVESHYDVWTLEPGTVNAVASTVTPLDSQSVGTCGAHTLSFAANYVPYTGSAGSIAPRSAFTGPYPATISGISYSVRPFAAKVQIQSSSSTTITFANAGRTAPAAAFTSGATWTSTWELLDAAGQTIGTPQTTTQAVGTVPPFAISKGTGSKVRLTLSINPTMIVDSTCASLSSHVDEYAMISPDAKIDIVSGCTNALGPCTLTAGSISGTDQTGWSYQWKLNGSAVPGATAKTYSPSFATAANYTVVVDALNPIGNSSASKLLTINPPACSPYSVTASVGVASPSTVDAGVDVAFNASIYGYNPQDCDSFAWTFGDGATASTQQATHAYAANGSYAVTVRMSHPDGTSRSGSLTITVGTQPPPPPTCPLNAPSTSNVYPNWSGLTSGCNPVTPCSTGEIVSFQPQTYNYTVQSCDTFLWNFGDSKTSTLKAPTHVYTTTGTFSVTLKISNSLGSGTGVPAPLKVQTGGSGNCTPPGQTAVALVAYSGPTSQCSAASGSPSCAKNETIAFTASAFNYNIQSCDTFAWTFGDGTTSTQQNPTHQYTSDVSYNVILTISTSGNKTLTAQVAVKVGNVGGGGGTPAPTVTAISSATTASVNTLLTFTATATPAEGITAWAWNFGDGSIQNGQSSMQHAYKDAGSYDVQVRVTNAGGQSPPAILRVVITPGAAFAFILPVVGHFNGNLGTKWRSDVQIFNPSTEPMTLTFEFKGIRGFKRDVLIESSTRVYEDVLKTMAPYLFVDTPGCVSGADQSCGEAGPMIISGTSSKVPQIWSRTYTVSQTGVGTFGQQIPAVPITSSQPSGSQPTRYIIAGVENSTRFRTNLGLVNPSASPLTVTVKATDDAAQTLGSEFTVTIPAYQFTQIGDLSTRIVDSKGQPYTLPYTLRVTPATNSPVVAYGSIIDNRSNDPVYIPGTPDTAQSPADMQAQFIPGVGHLQQANGTWRSDVTIFNPDSDGIRFTARYYDSTGAKIGEVKDQPLAPNTFVRVDDIVHWPLFTTQPPDSFGVLTVETTSLSVGKYPIVTSRTYKDRGELGSYGQGISGISTTRPNVVAGKPAYIAGVRSDLAYYTNLGIIGLGTQPADVLVSLLDKTTGQVVGTWRRTYADGTPNRLFLGESLIARDILRALSLTADSGTLKIEVVGDGGPVWAYASIIDQTTSDPEYVPAVPLN